jgi:GTP-binding protein Era
MERFLQKKVFLELYVRVNKDWRKDQNSLNKLGYGQ